MNGRNILSKAIHEISRQGIESDRKSFEIVYEDYSNYNDYNNYDDYSNYSDYSNYDDYSNYNDYSDYSDYSDS